jgi:hypothetical protein
MPTNSGLTGGITAHARCRPNGKYMRKIIQLAVIGTTEAVAGFGGPPVSPRYLFGCNVIGSSAAAAPVSRPSQCLCYTLPIAL